MLIPISSDAPLRCWPFATIGLVIANVLVFILQWQFPGFDDFGILDHGSINPIQWVTSTFMHGNLVHLLGNMIFLIVFGHVVEGRCGHLAFIALFVGIGLIQNMLEQSMMLFVGGSGSLGASSAIYGIMVIAALWCTKCNINCAFVLFFRVFGSFPVSLPIFVAIYVVWDFIDCLISGFAMSTPFLHFMGALVGLAVGGVILWNRWVECEGLDALSMFEEWSGKERSVSKAELKERDEHLKALRNERVEKIHRIHRSIDMHLKAGQTTAAFRLLLSAHRMNPRLRWIEELARAIIAQYQTSKDWQSLTPAVEFYLEHYRNINRQAASSMAINQALVFLKYLHDPSSALKMLKPLDPAQLNEAQRQHFVRIQRDAKRALNFGDSDTSGY